MSAMHPASELACGCRAAKQGQQRVHQEVQRDLAAVVRAPRLAQEEFRSQPLHLQHSCGMSCGTCVSYRE